MCNNVNRSLHSNREGCIHQESSRVYMSYIHGVSGTGPGSTVWRKKRRTQGHAHTHTHTHQQLLPKDIPLRCLLCPLGNRLELQPGTLEESKLKRHDLETAGILNSRETTPSLQTIADIQAAVFKQAHEVKHTNFFIHVI